MISLLLSLQAITLAFTFIFLALIYYAFILPKQRLAYYAKQGIHTYFSPVLGMIRKNRDDQVEYGDYLKEPKLSSKVTPGQKALASNLGSKAIVSFRDPKYIKETLQFPTYYKKSAIFDLLKYTLGTGLGFLEGDAWKVRRKTISSCFHYDFLQNNTPLIQETVNEFLDKIPPETYKECEIMDKIQQITGEVVGRVFYGRCLNRYSLDGMPLTLALAQLMGDVGAVTRSGPYMLFGQKIMDLPFPKYQKIKQRVRDLRAQCSKIIEDRKNDQGKYHDLLSALLATRNNEEPSQGVSDEEITNEFISFFVGGMDTTGHLVSSVLYYLAKNQQYLEKIHKEREQVYKTEKSLQVDALQGMVYLSSAIKESLRLSTPVPWILLREALVDHNVADIKIKKGTLVRSEFFPSLYNEKYFEEPEKFKPERWEDPQNKIDAYAFIPFSAGPRNCIGQHMAILEAKIIISEFLEKFDYKLIENYEMKETLRFLYEPLDPIKFTLTPKT